MISSSMDSILTLSVDDAGVATILWDLQNAPMNVFTQTGIDAFAQAVERVRDDGAIKGVVIASGKRAFHAGADLKMVRGLFTRSPEELWAFITKPMEMLYRLESCGKPVAAAIGGHALGGGFEMALAAHARFVADDARIKLGLPEAAIGLMPGFGGTQRLTRLMDYRQATRDMLKGRTYTPRQAAHHRLVTGLVPADRLIEAARDWVLSNPDAAQPWKVEGYVSPPNDGMFESFFADLNSTIAKETWGHSPAERLIADAVYHGLQLAIEPALRLEGRRFVELIGEPSAAAVVRTKFFAIREARALDRRPIGPVPTDFQRIGIVGSGLMGAGIAYTTALSGLNVALIDIDQAAAEAGKTYAMRLLDKDIARDRTTEARKVEVLRRINATTDYTALAECDLVIEAVFEDAALKRKVLAAAEAAMRENAVLASNTSTIPIGQLAEALERPAQFLGLHFFSPVEKMPLLEIISGAATRPETLALGFDIAKQLGKVPIAVNDGRAFYTTRVVTGYMMEGMALLAEGVAPALIENAGRRAGMPMGPLRLSDMVNIDLIESIEAQTERDLGVAYPAHPGRPVAQAMLQAGRLGEKTRAGFYIYDSDAPRLWDGLGIAFPQASEQPAGADIVDRLLFRQAAEALRCFDDGVVQDARDADLGSVLGWGFAPHTGGIASFIDQCGARAVLRYCEAAERRLGARFAPSQKLRDLVKSGEMLHTA